MAEEASETIALRYLCPQERERFYSFRYDKRKVEWLAGRIAAKCAGLLLHHDHEAIRYGQKHWQQLQIAAGSSGKPFAIWSDRENTTPLHVSISHSGKWALAMAARENCGVDIQQVTPAVERVEARFVSAEEREMLVQAASLYGRQAALTLLWSAKEAVKKTWDNANLPGFLDIRLHSIQQSHEDYLFAVHVQVKESSQKISQFVWVSLLDGFAYAMTMQNQGRL